MLHATGRLVVRGGGCASIGATGDFNLDGKLDLAAANRNTDDVTILRGDGAGGFAAAAGNAARTHNTEGDTDE